MTLEFSLEGNILTVKQSILSFFTTQVTYWYYDIANWTSSLTGKKGEAPNSPMLEASIEWVKKHYLPKVQNN